jgi:AcrR family transcriptional regulator
MTVSGTAAAAQEPGTRRDRLRRELIDEIKTVASGQIEEFGPAGVTLRGVARDVGISPAAIYSYFDNLDALLLAVVTDNYNALADAVGAAADAMPHDDLGGRLLAAIHAYRSWALAHQGAFRLLFFRPASEFSCAVDNDALNASLRVFVPMLAVLLEGWSQGLIPPAASGPEVDTSGLVTSFGLDISSDQLREACSVWALFHGIVALELGGHFASGWLDPDELFDAAVRERIRGMGLSV